MGENNEYIHLNNFIFESQNYFLKMPEMLRRSSKRTRIADKQNSLVRMSGFVARLVCKSKLKPLSSLNPLHKKSLTD